ncbi:MAG: hypothetical protein V4737_18300, partial [Curtobacterium sp.]
MTGRTKTSRSELARLGFAELSESLERIATLERVPGLEARLGSVLPHTAPGSDAAGGGAAPAGLPAFDPAAIWGATADPDGALRSLERLSERAPEDL